MAATQFYLQLGNQRKVGRVADDSHVVFGQKFSFEKGSVTRCIVVMQQPVLLSPKFENVIVVCGIDCLACQNKFFVNNPLHV
jgi:hypothetical protein